MRLKYEKSFGITREQFNSNFSFPNSESEIIKIADGLMKNRLTSVHTIKSAEYDINNLDWNIKFSEASGTFQLFLQGLYPVVYLVKAYETGLCSDTPVGVGGGFGGTSKEQRNLF